MVQGVDVSKRQNPDDMDWDRLAQEGIAFAYIRASVGTEKDPAYVQHHLRAGGPLLLRGADHLLTPSDPYEQLEVFLKAIASDAELPPALRVEDLELEAETVHAFVQHFPTRLVIYTSASRWRAIVGDDADRAKDCDLWVAHWTDSAQPLLPSLWDSWTFWQYTSQGRLPGHDFDLDLDRFNGTQSELYRYAWRDYNKWWAMLEMSQGLGKLIQGKAGEKKLAVAHLVQALRLLAQAEELSREQAQGLAECKQLIEELMQRRKSTG